MTLHLISGTMKRSEQIQTSRRRAAHRVFYSLAIGRMFGGIPDSFLKTYHEHLPKTEPEEEYELRSELYQLYHYLNHTVLFGVRVECTLASPNMSNGRPTQSSYAGGAMQKMRVLLQAFPEDKC